MKGLSYANITFLSQNLSKTLEIHSADQRNVNSTNRARFTLLETTTYVYITESAKGVRIETKVAKAEDRRRQLQ